MILPYLAVYNTHAVLSEIHGLEVKVIGEGSSRYLEYTTNRVVLTPADIFFEQSSSYWLTMKSNRIPVFVPGNIHVTHALRHKDGTLTYANRKYCQVFYINDSPKMVTPTGDISDYPNVSIDGAYLIGSIGTAHTYVSANLNLPAVKMHKVDSEAIILMKSYGLASMFGAAMSDIWQYVINKVPEDLRILRLPDYIPSCDLFIGDCHALTQLSFGNHMRYPLRLEVCKPLDILKLPKYCFSQFVLILKSRIANLILPEHAECMHICTFNELVLPKIKSSYFELHCANNNSVAVVSSQGTISTRYMRIVAGAGLDFRNLKLKAEKMYISLEQPAEFYAPALYLDELFINLPLWQDFTVRLPGRIRVLTMNIGITSDSRLTFADLEDTDELFIIFSLTDCYAYYDSSLNSGSHVTVAFNNCTVHQVITNFPESGIKFKHDKRSHIGSISYIESKPDCS